MNLLAIDGIERIRRRRRKAQGFQRMCSVLTWTCVLLLAVLLYHIASEGLAYLGQHFLENSNSQLSAAKAGIRDALFGTLWLMGATAMISIPAGVAAAIYLEEFARPSRLNSFIEINVTNLAGVPSIVFGILGLAIFSRFFHLGNSVLAGALTMSLLILPVIITASREAIRAVPNSIRLAAYGIGASKWQTVSAHVLPAAIPGIVTGVILSLSRAIGETAPLITIGVPAFYQFSPETFRDTFTALPMQIYGWASDSREEFQHLAAAGIIVLLGVLLMMNAVAVFIRQRAQRNIRW